MNQKLTFAFREYVPLYLAQKINYSPCDYIIITKGNETVCYLIGDLHKVEAFCKKLSQKSYRAKLIKDCIGASFKLSNYNYKKNLSKLSVKELQLEFKKLIKLILDWLDFFLLTEAEYWKGQENVVSKKEQTQLSKLRFEAKQLMVKCFQYLNNKLLKNLALKSKLKYSDISNYTYDDILKLPHTLNKTQINARFKSWGIIKSKGKISLMTKKQITYFSDLIKKEEKQKELNGISVYKGIVKGKVKIVKVNASKKIKNLNLKNKILVTNMTQPNMVPFMKGCIGIITNEGGMLCHASIIAREFKIPCVVGTKHATQILKNNELVELDANKGTIKIL